MKKYRAQRSVREYRKLYALLYLILFAVLLFVLADQRQAITRLEIQLERQTEWTDYLIQVGAEQQNMIDYFFREQLKDTERIRQLEEFLAPVLVDKLNVSAYAPLDPRAVAGMCYEGDPNVTASGEPPVPGETAAAGRSIPFGSMAYVAGRGWYRVNDRGSMIGDDNLDLVMASQTEALKFGRRDLPVLIVPAEGVGM